MKGCLSVVTLALAFVLVTAAIGCGEARPPAGGVQPVEPPGVGELIRGCGVWILRAGIIAMVAGILGVIASGFVAVLQPLREYMGELAIVGAAALVLGASLVWLGDNPWILWGSLLAGAAWCLWRYWPKLARFFRQVR